ncbi:activating transcription factor 3 [Cloeon dipterum]|uniref:activating transcription factor 3 n=1 Tax=Cloeon dipterum TaxID=197152 RepID=UPI0032207F91
MYNLNVNVAATAASTLAAAEGSCAAPRTPEVLNSVIAMSSGLGSPFSYPHSAPATPMGCCGAAPPAGDDSGGGGAAMLPPPAPPSVQHTCSQLIKEGLKLTIQSKRRHHSAEAAPGGAADPLAALPDDPSAAYSKLSKMYHHSVGSSGDDELTTEDAERRRRRRERNKIAATKCRLKKREKTVNLVQESEVLDSQNQELKAQIKNLESEQRHLMDMLTMHQSSCLKLQPQSEYVDPHQVAPHLSQQQQFANYYSTGSPPRGSPPSSAYHVDMYSAQGMDSGCIA